MWVREQRTGDQMMLTRGHAGDPLSCTAPDCGFPNPVEASTRLGCEQPCPNP